MPGVSKKKKVTIVYEWCNIINVIFWHGNYNFHLAVCKVSIQYFKGNYSYDCVKNGGSKRGLDDKMCLCVFYYLYFDSKSCLTHHSSQIHNFRYVWHTEFKFHKQLDKSCIMSETITIVCTCVTMLKILIICCTILFLRHSVFNYLYPIMTKCGTLRKN